MVPLDHSMENADPHTFIHEYQSRIQRNHGLVEWRLGGGLGAASVAFRARIEHSSIFVKGH